jgi:hypothetical protein
VGHNPDGRCFFAVTGEKRKKMAKQVKPFLWWRDILDPMRREAVNCAGLYGVVLGH